jgi:Asp-tRNA(Asn)/Glu-tRNA(Gln) amidotransferase A subunit family amidase
MNNDELRYLSAQEMAARIRDRSLSPVELVESALERIAKVNPKLNCFCFTYPEEAIAKAKVAEQAAGSGRALGPLHGVPIAIKDLTPTKGKTTTLGSYAYKDWVPDEDALVVKNLLNAGAIMVGKTTTPEFAFSSLTDTPLWGITRNPWNPDRTPGGSSGGSAAAVVSGCVPLAEGSDAGGSVRIPAAHSGCVGLKPSSGRIPFEFLPTQYDYMLCHGPLSRTVDDAALFLTVCQGPNERDLNSLQTPLEVPTPVPSDVQGRRFALSIDFGYYHIDADVEKNTRAAAEALRDAGAIVEEVDLGWTKAFNEAWWSYWGVFEATHFGQHLAKWRDQMHPTLVTAMEEGLSMSAVDLMKTETAYTEAWEKLRPILDRCEVLLCPTESIPAPAVDYDELGAIAVDKNGKFLSMDMTMQFNALKLPALSVPSGFSKDGLPTGLQIVGRRFDDLSVLRVGAAIERLLPWRDHHPSL